MNYFIISLYFLLKLAFKFVESAELCYYFPRYQYTGSLYPTRITCSSICCNTRYPTTISQTCCTRYVPANSSKEFVWWHAVLPIILLLVLCGIIIPVCIFCGVFNKLKTKKVGGWGKTVQVGNPNGTIVVPSQNQNTNQYYPNQSMNNNAAYFNPNQTISTIPINSSINSNMVYDKNINLTPVLPNTVLNNNMNSNLNYY